MSIFDLFSKRQKKLRGEIPDVYRYDDIPKNLRIQIIHIVRDVLGNETSPGAHQVYEFINKTLCKEYGLFYLGEAYEREDRAIFNFLLNEKKHEYCLDVIEIFFKVINKYVRENPYKFLSTKQKPDKAIEELNIRFKEAGVGYQFEQDELIRVDSQFIHSEVVKPVLQLLGKDPDYQGAFAEFLSAHEHYRHQRYKECLNECLKAFESLMKSIHKKHSWPFNQNDTAKKLINSCLNNGLVPIYLQNQFSSLNILLESGVPTIRNKEGGHGQGHEIKEVPEHLTSYALHLTATNLLFLIKCEESI
ncbi:hypothetical protein R4578_05115 [Acinetobacter baumannii]|uniref:STM4504/CBY_0614 family protein n=1 Tax=Acinetobacter baumannii TaxID=470 RepID=UPI00244854CC|nr:hypothetical protein [Acinetobacter baumannii]MDH2499085.1 hypothetical protein [Acinetobacter baumannii]MDV7611040.1 hypothetical protein [Acinetobacter baumannii]